MPPLRAIRVEQRAQAEGALAAEIVALVRARPAAVLGIATGRTPVGLFAEVARQARAQRVEFGSVRAIVLDELCGLDARDPRSFAAWTRRHVLEPLAIPPENARALDGAAPAEAADALAAAYEAEIAAVGGIDLQVLGLGRNGHLGFNEPGSAPDSRTRVVELHEDTRADAAQAFGGIEQVPARAITLGLATILEARALRVLAFGASKRTAVRRLLGGAPVAELPAAVLRDHPDATLWFDAAAADPQPSSPA